MKGIILAGGSGTRLYPLTLTVSKQLMPVYDKPMIYYPLTCLMLAGIREILIITTPHDQASFKKLLGNGKAWGLSLSYATQASPNGLAEAFIIGEAFIDQEPCCLILGDNIFYGHGLTGLLAECAKIQDGALILAYWVNNPEAYGVVQFGRNGDVLSLEEKPKQPKSHYAVPGIYFYDGQASALAKRLAPSARGELEITGLNNLYLSQGKLRTQILGRGVAWLDAGTHDSLMEAANFIQVVQKRQGLQIACPEEIAFRSGLITAPQLRELALPLVKTGYGTYLMRLLEEMGHA